MKTAAIVTYTCLWLVACSHAPDPRTEARFAALRRENAELRAKLSRIETTRPKESLAHQMLDVQIRHERLWAAGNSEDWTLAHFQLSRLNKSLNQVMLQNGDHAALQPQRLDEVLPSTMQPAMVRVRSAIDHQNRVEFVASYDALTAACSACHQAADHGFLIVQRPVIALSANLRDKP